MNNSLGIVSLVFGVVGTTLGVLSFLRDRATIVVELQWDMSVTPGTGYDHTKKWGLIKIANVGRRPIYVSHVALRLPRDADYSYIVIADGIAGTTLKEGDPAKVHLVDQSELGRYKNHWRDMVAQVSDISGREWRSRKLPKDKRPSWAA